MLQRYTRPLCFLALVAGIAVFAALISSASGEITAASVSF